MTSWYDDLSGRVRDLTGDLSRPPVVAISGHGGAGKSTLASRLALDLGVAPDQIVRTDRFYAAGTATSDGLFDAHDWPALFTLLGRIRRTPTPEQLTYSTRTFEGAIGRRASEMPPVVIVEGIRLLRPETTDLFDLSVWIDMDPDAAGVRALERNRAQGDSHAELDLWRTRWIPEGWTYERELQPASLADLVVTAAG